MSYVRALLSVDNMFNQMRAEKNKEAIPVKGSKGLIKKPFELDIPSAVETPQVPFYDQYSALNELEERIRNAKSQEEMPEGTGPSTVSEDAIPRPKRNPQRFAKELSKVPERELLALTIQAEAGGEGYDGMLAVGSVMANRAASGRYGKSMRDVLLAPGQFSAWNGFTGHAKGEGAIDMANLRASEDAYKAADAILSKNYTSPVGSSTHYYNPKAATPKWGKEAGGDWQTLGNHIFGSVK